MDVLNVFVNIKPGALVNMFVPVLTMAIYKSLFKHFTEIIIVLHALVFPQMSKTNFLQCI